MAEIRANTGLQVFQRAQRTEGLPCIKKDRRSGSNIKNSVLHAAFLAAASGEAVSMRHVIAGVRNEFEKSGKILSREQLGQYYMLLEV